MMESIGSPSALLFDEAPLSPQRSDVSLVSIGRQLSPHVPSAPAPSRVPNIFDQIVEWFSEIIRRRKLVGSGVAATFSGCTFVLLSILLQSSLLHPFQFISSAISTFFSLSTWAAALFSSLVYFLLFLTFTIYLFKWDQPVRPSLLRSDGWLSVILSFFAHSFSTLLLFSITGSSFNSQESSLFLLFSLLCSSAVGVFRRDFRLFFPPRTARQGVRGCLWECFSLAPSSTLSLSAREAVLVHEITLGLFLLPGLLVWGFLATVSTVLSPSVHLTAFLLSFCHLFIGRVAIQIIREVVMTPMVFPLPPTHSVLSPTPQQTRTLLNVLSTPHPFLRLFAFLDLSRLAWADPSRRQEVFSLSQPGGHPRNWTAICSACLAVLQQSKTAVEMANREMGGEREKEESEDDDIAIHRDALRMPDRIRQQVYNTAVRSRYQTALRSRARAPRVAAPPTIWQRAKTLAEAAPSVVPAHDALTVQLAIEGLYQLVLCSFDEDRYGVVQKDLAAIISTILGTLSTIDRHFRLRQTRAGHAAGDAPLLQLRDVLQAALFRITTKFSSHLSAIGLSREELAQVEALC